MAAIVEQSGRGRISVGPSSSAASDERRAAWSDGEAVVERWFRAMNTDVHVVVVGGDGQRALDEAERLVSDREARWSRFLPNSELSMVNDSPGRPVIVSPETFSLIAKAVEAWEATDGAFDPTIGTSMRSAGYDRSFNQLDALAGARAQGSVSGGYLAAPTPRQVELHDVACAITVAEGVSLDLGGIAKGETADVVVAALLAAGAEGCCVNIGGDLRAEGRAPGGDGWTVTLDCPGSDEQRAVALAAGAVCTSTVVKRRWTSANGSEHHLRDPRTGASLDTDVMSLSVIAARADQAEVLTKAAMAAGIEGAEAVVTGRGATGLLVDAAGSLRVFAGFERFTFDETRSPSPADPSSRCSNGLGDVRGVESGP